MDVNGLETYLRANYTELTENDLARILYVISQRNLETQRDQEYAKASRLIKYVPGDKGKIHIPRELYLNYPAGISQRVIDEVARQKLVELGKNVSFWMSVEGGSDQTYIYWEKAPDGS